MLHHTAVLYLEGGDGAGGVPLGLGLLLADAELLDEHSRHLTQHAPTFAANRVDGATRTSE